jgi:TetR/AcrR family transcriptional repressor of mexJK operon
MGALRAPRYSQWMSGAKDSVASPSRLGRPPAAQVESRNMELLDAATEVFLEAGFAGAKMAAIARRAGASMETLYARYPTKAELFAALIERKASGLLHLIGSLSPDTKPREALTYYAMQIVTMMTSPDTQKFHRLVIAGSMGSPELGEMFWKAGPGRGHDLIRAYLNEQNLRGTLSIENVDRTTRLFMGMMSGGIALQATLGMRTMLQSEPERRAWAEYVVDMFLKMLL